MRDTDEFDAGFHAALCCEAILLGVSFCPFKPTHSELSLSMRAEESRASTAMGSAGYFRQVYGANFLWILISVTIQAGQARFGELIVQES